MHHDDPAPRYAIRRDPWTNRWFVFIPDARPDPVSPRYRPDHPAIVPGGRTYMFGEGPFGFDEARAALFGPLDEHERTTNPRTSSGRPERPMSEEQWREIIDSLSAAGIRVVAVVDEQQLADHRAAQIDAYVLRTLAKPDGMEELHAQGIYPNPGPEPYRATVVNLEQRPTVIHDRDCDEWKWSGYHGAWGQAGTSTFAQWHSETMRERGPFHARRD